MKTARKAGESTSLPTFEQLESFAAFNGATADAFMKASRAYWNALSELNGELSDFFNKRLEHDMDLSQSVAGCDDWEKVVRLQQDWARTAMEEYASETTKLTRLYSQANMEGWRTFYGQASAGSKAQMGATSEQPKQQAPKE